MNKKQIEDRIKCLEAERNGNHTMIEDLSFHLQWFDDEIARLKRRLQPFEVGTVRSAIQQIKE